jgi:hypothetical protein
MSTSIIILRLLSFFCGITGAPATGTANECFHLGAGTNPSSTALIDALAPPVSAASFLLKTYDRVAHMQIDRNARLCVLGGRVQTTEQASVRVSWSRAILSFAKPGAGSTRQTIDPNRVQEIVHTTRSRAEAVKCLREHLGWSTSPDNLSKYLRHHELSAPWQKIPPEQSLITKIVQNVRTEAEALRRMRSELGWSITAASLTRYMKNHGLRAPWQYLDPVEVRRLVQDSRSLSDTAERIVGKFGRVMSRHALSDYIRRHQIEAPWVGKYKKGEASQLERNA